MNDDGITKSNDPKLAAARVFIGNLPSDRTTKEDLQEKFKPYGKILGALSVHFSALLYVFKKVSWIFKGFQFTKVTDLFNTKQKTKLAKLLKPNIIVFLKANR